MGEGVISGWTEGILFSLAFVLILSLVITNFNGLYGEDNQIGLGTNTTASAFINYQDTSGQQITGGEVDFDSSSGITLRSSWGVVKNIFSIVSNFLTGGWIEDIFAMTNLGEAGQIWAKYLRIIYVISLILAILYILFKVKA